MNSARIVGIVSSRAEIKASIIPATKIEGKVVASGPKGESGYTPPSSYPASMIVEDAERMFVTEAEKAALLGFRESDVFTQMVSSATWTIQHNLDKYPSVTVIDSAGTICVGEIQYISSNKLVLIFSSAFSGIAYLN